jgi:hypothetical protein
MYNFKPRDENYNLLVMSTIFWREHINKTVNIVDIIHILWSF